MKRKLLPLALVAAIGGLLAWNVAHAPTETHDQAVTRCASIAALGRDGEPMVGVPAIAPDGYRNGELTANGCTFIALEPGR